MTMREESEVSVDKMREDFEAWFVGKYPRSRNGVRTWDGREGSTDYISDYARSHWEAWQASRKALVIDLPDYTADSDDELSCFDGEYEWSNRAGAQYAVLQCAKVLSEAGITVKGEGDAS